MKASYLISVLFFFVLSFSLYAQSGNVGIGTTQPQKKLHVSGDILADSNLYADTLQIQAIRIPSNAQVGHVLTSDGSGNGQWMPQSSGGTGNTLDQAYDEGVNAGDGREIQADAGALKIIGGANNPALEVLSVDTFSAVTIGHQGPGSGLSIGHSGWGNGLNIYHTGTTGNGLFLSHNNNMHAIDIEHFNDGHGLNLDHSGSGDGLNVQHSGSGIGIDLNMSGSANGLKIHQSGSGYGVDMNMSGSANGLTIQHSGSGYGIDLNMSGSAQGLYVSQANTYPAIEIASSGSGIGMFIHQTGTNQGLTITQANNENGIDVQLTGTGTGIIGRQLGMGWAGWFEVTNASNTLPALGGSTTGTGTGITGITGNDVWGYSQYAFKAGVVGYSGSTDNSRVGVRGHSYKGVGIIGESRGDTMGVAGIRAIGNGAQDKAAALQIVDGAIRVTGSARPAGRDTLNSITWTSYGSALTAAICSCPHGHEMGHSSNIITINNSLVSADRSIIMLTVQNSMPIPYHGVSVMVESVANGSFDIRLNYGLTPEGTPASQNPPPPASVIINYLIINE